MHTYQYPLGSNYILAITVILNYADFTGQTDRWRKLTGLLAHTGRD